MENPKPQESPSPEILVGVSSCLLGNRVRFDGGHKRSRFITDRLADHVRLVPVCPEVEVGMGTPRETVRLVKAPGGGVRLVAPSSGIDYTAPMQSLVEKRVRNLQDMGIVGFVLKAKSPTCGMERVRLYGPNGIPSKNGVGMFAAELKRQMPSLPLEEEGRLNDAGLRALFVRRIFAYARAQTLFGSEWKPKDLVDFHQREKLMLKVHDPVSARELGSIVAHCSEANREETEEAYFPLFMENLSKHASRGAHDSLFQRMLGRLRKYLDDHELREVSRVITEFRNGLVSIDVPKALLSHYARVRRVNYLRNQTYFQPWPQGAVPAAAAEGAY